MASAVKTVALFGKKSAAAPAKKAASAPKKAASPSSGKTTGQGWLGSNSRSWNPEKWRVGAFCWGSSRDGCVSPSVFLVLKKLV